MDNPIVQRLKKLTFLWLEFTDEKEARICRWLVKADEVSMIKTFYQLQTSEGNDTADFFIQLSAPLNSVVDYSSGIKNEFLDIIKSIQEESDEEDIKSWGVSKKFMEDSTLESALKIFERFAECLKLPEGFLVIYLTPASLKKQADLIEWLQIALEIGISERVRFMMMDALEDPLLDELCENYPQLAHTIEPNLNMSAAVKKLASAGDASDPGVKFRKAYVLLTQAIAKQDMSLVKKTSEKAFKIADKNKWPHMKVAVKMATAGAFLGKSDYDKAYDLYGEAFTYSEDAFKEGDIASGKLAVTTLFSQASAMIGAKKFDIALESYERAIPFAIKTEDFYNQMEAWRMAGYCQSRLKKYDAAWEAYAKALDSGEKLDEQLRKSSTLPFVGYELKLLANRTDHADQVDRIEERMIHLVGENWTEKLEVV
ncbi:hypothetical protein [Saccharicrinis sp. 156]|uniref:hypothetical protein n=1 Tax=Saccharicrinis sp. 156 TaxID=3417574 RepID=UPI003D329430